MLWRIGWVVVLTLAGSIPAFGQVPDAAAARSEMVEVVELEARILSPETGILELDPRVLDAMREVPRHVFVPEPLRDWAYRPHPLPVGHEQNIAAPVLVALMTHLIEPEEDDVVFETGTGAGYHAAVLSRLVAQVYSMEVVEPLVGQAAALLKEQGYDNVAIQAGDGYYGWPAKAPFDKIIVKEAIDHVPSPLLGQLKRGGRMVIPIGPAGGPQYLTVVSRDQAGKLSERRIMPVRFSPLQGGQRL